MNMIRFKRKNIIILVVIIFAILIYLDFRKRLIYEYSLIWGSNEDVKCYKVLEEDTLMQAESDSFNPRDNSVFFHETSCKGYLNSRQACAVESAARTNPDLDVFVLFTGPVTVDAMANSISMDELRKFDNIYFARVNLLQYSKGTPLQKLVESSALYNSYWPMSHTSDVLRYLSLYKWGGIYLDLDVIVAKPLTLLAKNFAGKQNIGEVASGVMSFSGDNIGRTFAEIAVRDLAENFRGDVWANNGPGTIKRTLNKICNTTDITLFSAAQCQGFEVYDESYFYPIPYEFGYKYFDVGDIPKEEPYVYHVWNRFTKHLTVNKESLYAKIAKKYCPAIFKSYEEKFGS